MAGIRLTTEGFILRRQPSSADGFEQLLMFSREQGNLVILRRIRSKQATTAAPSLDLFDEVAVDLESSSQGRTWFLREAQLKRRFGDIGKSYEKLLAASRVATLIARNAVHEESRDKVAVLLEQAFSALDQSNGSPEVIYFKTLFRFARDEGYPAKQDWWENLPDRIKSAATILLNTPTTELAPEAISTAPNLSSRLELWLRGHTEILVE